MTKKQVSKKQNTIRTLPPPPPSLPEINGDDDEWLYPAAPRPGRPRR